MEFSLHLKRVWRPKQVKIHAFEPQGATNCDSSIIHVTYGSLNISFSDATYTYT
jgi:hypothetical protein